MYVKTSATVDRCVKNLSEHLKIRRVDEWTPENPGLPACGRAENPERLSVPPSAAKSLPMTDFATPTFLPNLFLILWIYSSEPSLTKPSPPRIYLLDFCARPCRISRL